VNELSLSADIEMVEGHELQPEFAGAGKEPGLLVWRMEALVPTPVSPKHHGRFYSGDAYILLHTKKVSSKLTHDIYFWLGEASSIDEQGSASILAVELDNSLGGAAVQHREVQGHETAGFLAALPGGRIEYMAGGVKSGFHHVQQAEYPTRLLRVKGRRHARVNQVALSAASLNNGDVFILDAGTTLYQWNGAEANKKERTRALEVCKGIRDDRVHSIGVVPVVLMESCSASEADAFWKALGGKSPNGIAPAEPDTAEAESQAAESTQLWRLAEVLSDGGRKKLQITEVVGRPLKRSMLDPDDAFILAAPSEVWIWIGSRAAKVEREKAMVYAQSFLKGKKRPPWTPVTRVVQGAEPTLFTCKFVNWAGVQPVSFNAPGTVSSGRVAHVSDNRSAADVAQGMVADPQSMAAFAAARAAESTKLLPPDGVDGTLRIWRVNAFKKQELPRDLHGLFYAGDTYIVHYSYVVRSREMHLLYHWHGRVASQDEHGTAAILCKEIDDRELAGAATQVRVVQNNEPGHFLALFKGTMVVRDGGISKTGKDSRDADGVALFQVKGLDATAVRAVQVREQCASLNSTDCFVLQRPGQVIVWKGSKSSAEEHARAESTGRAVAARLAAAVKSGDIIVSARPKKEAAPPAAAPPAVGGSDPISVVLEGETPDGAHADKLGVFMPTGSELNGRPTYARENNTALMLWWSGGRWWLGKLAELGQNRGWIKCESEATVAHQVEQNWVVYSSAEKKWKQADALRLAAARAMMLGGECPRNAHADKLGRFVQVGTASSYESFKQPDTPIDALDRPVYAREGRPNLMMWWASGRWWLGKRDELGMSRGWCKVEASSMEPYESTNTWVVYSSSDKKWLDAPGLRCEPPAKPSATPPGAGRDAPPQPPPGVPPGTWEVVVCHEGAEPATFWEALGGKGWYASERASDAAVPHPPRLFQCSNSSGAFKVEEIFDFSQEDLEQDDVFILDTYVAVYVWVGKQANEVESSKAEETAIQYIQAQAQVDGRSTDCPVMRVKAGNETAPFTAHFVGWSDAKGQEFEDPYEKRKRQLEEEAKNAPPRVAPKPQLRAISRASEGRLPTIPTIQESEEEEEVPVPKRREAPTRVEVLDVQPSQLPPPSLSFLPSGGPSRNSRPTPTKPKPVQSFARPISAADPASTMALDLGRIDRSTAAFGQMDSARRRALAAGKTAEALGVGHEGVFADPETERFRLEEVTTNRTHRPLNPVCRELYLHDDDFKKVFGMSKEEFYSMKLWRQRELKKRMGLF